MCVAPHPRAAPSLHRGAVMSGCCWGGRKDGHTLFKWHNVKTTFPSANADPVSAADNIAGNCNGNKLFALCMRPGFVYGRLLCSSCADC